MNATSEPGPAARVMPSVRHLANDAPLENILAVLDDDGAVIVDGLLAPDLLAAFHADMEAAAAGFGEGTRSDDATIARFWGRRTKRFTRLATRSEAFVDILLNPTLLGAADALLLPSCSSYWMNTAQMMIVAPGEAAQVLHRDADNWRTMNRPDGFEVTVSAMFAITDFTSEAGATRVVPGSNRWADYSTAATDDQTCQAVMQAGSALLYTGRTIHGAGANVTLDRWRFGLHVSFVLGWLTPEEAGPLGADWATVSSLPVRAQQLLGWRCYSAGGRDSTRLWTVDYEDIPVGLGLIERT